MAYNMYESMGDDVAWGSFVWDSRKERVNQARHGLDFRTAAQAFLDPGRLIATDERHSGEEKRFFCIGRAGEGVATVRFTFRGDRIRIFGAGYWRKGRALYEETNSRQR